VCTDGLECKTGVGHLNLNIKVVLALFIEITGFHTNGHHCLLTINGNKNTLLNVAT
jgi:hypothetical protein